MNCPRCGTSIPELVQKSLLGEACPACGTVLSSGISKWRTGTDFVQAYFQDLWQIIAHPVLFFQKMPTEGGKSGPLAFALVTHWIGSALGFLWHLVLGGTVLRFLQNVAIMQSTGRRSLDMDPFGSDSRFLELRDHLMGWFFGAGPVILDPFLTLFSILFTSSLVFIGARILVSPGKGHPDQISFESALRIVCFGLTPAILSGLPVVGGFAASVWTVVVTVIGAREVYRIGTGRAVLVALFPKLIFFAIIGLGILFFAVSLMKLIMSVF